MNRISPTRRSSTAGIVQPVATMCNVDIPPESSSSGSGGRLASGEAICPYCGVGCRLRVEAIDGTLIRATGVADAPANLGGICAKGATLPQVVQGAGRLEHPLWRPSRSEPFQAVSWDAAMEALAARFRAIIDE